MSRYVRDKWQRGVRARGGQRRSAKVFLPYTRQLRFEPLEDRRLLSVAPISKDGVVQTALLANTIADDFDRPDPTVHNDFVLTGSQWNQPGGPGTPVYITYSYSNLLDGGLPGGLSVATLREATEEAFALWATYAPLNFIEQVDSGPLPIDVPYYDEPDYSETGHPNIRIGHQYIDGDLSGTGHLDTLAHSHTPFNSSDFGLGGDIHLDEGNTWAITGSLAEIFEIMAHEIGHSLGLDHTEFPTHGVMSPGAGGDFHELGTGFLFPDDIDGIRAIYGTGVGSVTPLAGTFVVDTVDDENDGNVGAGDLSLREAVALANKYTHSAITFSPSLSGQTINLSTGQIDIASSMEITGPGANLLTIVARDPTPSQKNSDGSRAFNVDDQNSFRRIVTISGLTIRGGDTNGSGGGILSSEQLTLAQVVITENAALDSGGGVESLAQGILNVRNSTISSNRARSSSGGGIHSFGGTALIEYSTIANNIANQNGGGVDSSGGNPLTIQNSTITGNHAGLDGGGVFTYHSTSHDVIEYTTIANNTADGSGGGIGANAFSTGSIEVLNATISSNTATGEGGGIDLNASNSASVLIDNCTISGNASTGDGGGVHVTKQSGAFVSLSHDTITSNQSTGTNGGGGLSCRNITISITHSIIAANSSPGPGNDDIDAGTQPVAPTYSLVGDNDGSGLAATPFGVPDANGNLVGPAYFQPTFRVFLEIAAMGDFEVASDSFQFEYSRDGGPWTVFLQSTVDESGTQTYTTAGGAQVVRDDPMLVGGVKLSNDFKSFNATIPGPAAELRIRFAATTNDENPNGGGSEAFAWRNMFVFRIPPTGAATIIGRAVQAISSSDMFASFFQQDADYHVAGDMFGVRSRLNPNPPPPPVESAGLPFAIADDSASSFPADVQGIITEADTFRFFGVVDTVDGVRNPTNIATWTFTNSSAPIDPMLGPLADNGGPTKTHALLLDSPAIDAGDPNFDPDDPDGDPQTDDAVPYDQRGAPYVRVLDGDGAGGARIDIGAVEYVPPAVLPTLFGDYNHDNTVNAADYTLWRNTLGQTGLAAYSGADGNGDGKITRLDYDVWKSHYGQTVPEIGTGSGAVLERQTLPVEVSVPIPKPVVGSYVANSGGDVALEAASMASNVSGEFTPPPAPPHRGEGGNPGVAFVLSPEVGRFVAAKPLTPTLSRREREQHAREAALLALFETQRVGETFDANRGVEFELASDSADVDSEADIESFDAACDAVFDLLTAAI